MKKQSDVVLRFEDVENITIAIDRVWSSYFENLSVDEMISSLDFSVLSETEKAVIYYGCSQNTTTKAIAASLRTTPVAVRKARSRGIAKLREQAKKILWDD